MKLQVLLLLVGCVLACLGLTQSQQVEPEREVTEVPNYDKQFSTFEFSENTTPPIDSIVDKQRELNNGCKQFKYNGSTPQFGNTTGPENYSAVDGQTLKEWCSSLTNPCCSTNGVVGSECSNWSTQPNTVYEVCENSCHGSEACQTVATNSADYSSITFWKDSCSSSGAGSACAYMARKTEKKLNLHIGEGSCSNDAGCFAMAGDAINLEELIVGNDSCTSFLSCDHVAREAQLKQLIIEANQCQSNNICRECGYDSIFSEALQLTTDCCNEVTGEPYQSRFDTACQYSEPSSIPSNQPSLEPYVEPPSPCANQKCNNAGKCEVTSNTDFKCNCENTFINSTDGGSCVCPPGFIRKSDNRCYDPTTPVPTPLTNIPPDSPNMSMTSAPTSSPFKETSGCNDDEKATFHLIRNNGWSVNCSWLTKNNDRTDTRIANYCYLHRVKTICKSTCSFCTCTDDDSFTFELINISDPSKKIKTCDWLTSNNKKSDIRIDRYCTEDFEGGAVMNACTKSCGLCK